MHQLVKCPLDAFIPQISPKAMYSQVFSQLTAVQDQPYIRRLRFILQRRYFFRQMAFGPVRIGVMLPVVPFELHQASS